MSRFLLEVGFAALGGAIGSLLKLLYKHLAG